MSDIKANPNPLAEKPVEEKVETRPCRSCGGTPSGLANMWICCGVAYGSQAEWNANNPPKAEPLPKCWCGVELVRSRSKPYKFYHDCAETYCPASRLDLDEPQIRFLFGENPRVKDLEEANRILGGAINGLRDEIASLESQLTQERMTASPLRGDIDILRAERDALQAKLDALPADKSAKLADELTELHRENYRSLRMLACVLYKK